MKKLQFFYIVTALALSMFSEICYATVYEFQNDGNVVVFEAYDYLSKAHMPKTSSSTFDPIQKKAYDRIIESASQKYKLDKNLIQAVICVESSYQPNALSPKGAQGLMQLMPHTAKKYGVTDAFDPDQNISGGTRYLRDLLDRYEGNRTLALAAYNAGEDAVNKYGGVPPYEETINYIKKVETILKNL